MYTHWRAKKHLTTSITNPSSAPPSVDTSLGGALDLVDLKILEILNYGVRLTKLLKHPGVA